MVAEPLVFHVRRRELDPEESWVYVWVAKEEGRIVYVGTTSMPPVVRTWLHLHHQDPGSGRIAARYASVGGNLSEPFDVLAFPVPESFSRSEVKRCVIRRLADSELLAQRYIGEPPGDNPGGRVAIFGDEVVAVIARLARES
ncbi:MAG: hypothetical protein ABSD78_16615 [Acidimicrobiales bacterium]|jgi:hypothetical protein